MLHLQINILLLFTLLFSTVQGKDCVILIHGLGRTQGSLSSLGNFLTHKEFSVYNIGYQSTKFSIQDICSLYIKPSISKIPLTSYHSVNFVTHSMGGIVLRYYLNKNKIKNCEKIIMICPPNQGSELVDSLKSTVNRLYSLLDGPAGQQLGHDSLSIISQLPPLSYRIGIIAGDKSMEPWFSSQIHGANDGKVKIEESQLSEMSDFIILHHTHTFIMNSRDTKEQVHIFLKSGQFNHSQ